MSHGLLGGGCCSPPKAPCVHSRVTEPSSLGSSPVCAVLGRVYLRLWLWGGAPPQTQDSGPRSGGCRLRWGPASTQRGRKEVCLSSGLQWSPCAVTGGSPCGRASGVSRDPVVLSAVRVPPGRGVPRARSELRHEGLAWEAPAKARKRALRRGHAYSGAVGARSSVPVAGGTPASHPEATLPAGWPWAGLREPGLGGFLFSLIGMVTVRRLSRRHRGLCRAAASLPEPVYKAEGSPGRAVGVETLGGSAARRWELRALHAAWCREPTPGFLHGLCCLLSLE